MSEIVINNDLLISLVEERPGLWDKTLNIYKDRDATRNAWRDVCLEIRKDFDELEDKEKNAFGQEVLKRWKNLRDAFMRAEKKMKESKASGSKASSKKKYIFHQELQFLGKVCAERETTDSFNVDNEENNTNAFVQVDKTTVSKAPPTTRKRKQFDEIDLKIMEALEKLDEEPNGQMAFFNSLLPHVQNFNDNEMLEFQMAVLQVISNIKNKRTRLSREFSPVHYQHHTQPFYSQPMSFQNEFQQPFVSQNTSFPMKHQAFQHPAASSPLTSPNITQHPYTSENISFPPVQSSTMTSPTSISALPNQLAKKQCNSAKEIEMGKKSAARYCETFSQHSNDGFSERSSSVNSACSSITYDFA